MIPKQIKGRIFPKEPALAVLQKKLRRQKKKIVFTSGSFDLIHVGHCRYLEEAKARGDVLVVGLSSNEAIHQVKGPDKPVLDQRVRAEMLLYLRAVDYVVVVNQPSCVKALKYLQPDIFITVGEEWNKGCQDCPEAKAVRAGGGKVVVVKRQSPKISTTAIMDSIVARQILKHFKKAIDSHNGTLKEHA